MISYYDSCIANFSATFFQSACDSVLFTHEICTHISTAYYTTALMLMFVLLLFFTIHIWSTGYSLAHWLWFSPLAMVQTICYGLAMIHYTGYGLVHYLWFAKQTSFISVPTNKLSRMITILVYSDCLWWSELVIIACGW